MNSANPINPEEIKQVKLLRLRGKMHALVERNPTKLIDDAQSPSRAVTEPGATATPTASAKLVPKTESADMAADHPAMPASDSISPPAVVPAKSVAAARKSSAQTNGPKKHINAIDMILEAKYAAEESANNLITEKNAEGAVMGRVFMDTQGPTRLS